MTVLLALITSAGAFDHGYAHYATFLAGAVNDHGLVRYDVLASRRVELDAALDEIAKADASAFSRDEKVAFYVNAYNAYTLRLVLDNQPLKSIRDLDFGQVWKWRTFTVAGEDVTLDTLEHARLRKMVDARIHAVVNCASRGCPPLPPTPLRPAGLEVQLDAYATRWVHHNAFSVVDGQVRLSKIFSWYAADFAAYRVDRPFGDDVQDGALGFIERFWPQTWDGVTSAAFADYDWSLNADPRRGG